jgi:hypothetical protein
LKPEPERLEGFDGEPALEGPLPDRDTVPGSDCGIELRRIVDAEIGQPRPNPRLVDDAVSPVPAGERNMGLEGGLDELGVGNTPTEPGENPHVTPLDQAETAGAACDLS